MAEDLIFLICDWNGDFHIVYRYTGMLFDKLCVFSGAKIVEFQVLLFIYLFIF